MYLVHSCKRVLTNISKDWRRTAASLAAICIISYCVASDVSAQTPSSPRDSKDSSPSTANQICDGQEAVEGTHVSLRRNASPADDAQMSKLDTDTTGMQSDAVTEPATSSTADGTEQHSLQCLRPHPDKESQKKSTPTAADVPIAPSGPIVTITDGMLTVDPHHAPLGAVLDAIRAIAGFELNIPRSEMDGQVFDQIGPLPVREALVQLLYGSGFNYIIQTVPGNPKEVTHVFVSPRIAGASETAAVGTANRTADESAEDQALYGGLADSSSEEQPPIRPAVAPTASAANVPGIPTGFNLKQAAEEAHKSPAEILDELQKHQIEILDAQAPPPQQ